MFADEPETIFPAQAEFNEWIAVSDPPLGREALPSQLIGRDADPILGQCDSLFSHPLVSHSHLPSIAAEGLELDTAA